MILGSKMLWRQSNTEEYSMVEINNMNPLSTYDMTTAKHDTTKLNHMYISWGVGDLYHSFISLNSLYTETYQLQWHRITDLKYKILTCNETYSNTSNE